MPVLNQGHNITYFLTASTPCVASFSETILLSILFFSDLSGASCDNFSVAHLN